MKLSKLFFCYILCMLLIACAKQLPAEKKAFVGTWISADSSVHITITLDGYIDYHNDLPGQISIVSAPIKSFNIEGFDTGIGPLSTTFKVNQPPRQDRQGHWYMIVNGYTLAKVL